MSLVTAFIAVLAILALECVAPAKPRSAPLPPSNRQSIVGVEAADPSLAFEAPVKFPILGSGEQVLNVTVTRYGLPVRGAVVGIVVWYQSDKRELPKGFKC